MRDRFADYHPLVNLLFFALTVTFSMVSMNPVCLLISLFASGAYSCLPDRGEHFRRMALWLVPMFLMALLINPAFNHRGVTALAYLPTGNILSLESILYGAAAGIMVVAVVLWFYSFTRVVTTDKLVYLFGRVTPSLGLLLTLTLRFVPRFTNHYRLLREAQTGLGAAEEKRGFKASVREMAALLSVLISWAVENASDAADSMRSRGFGTGKRTAFSDCRFTRKDALALAWMLCWSAVTAAGMLGGKMYFRYYPGIRYAAPDAAGVLSFLAYLLFELTPLLIDLQDTIHWKSIMSKT